MRRSKQEAKADKSKGVPRIVQSCFETSLQPGNKDVYSIKEIEFKADG